MKTTNEKITCLGVKVYNKYFYNNKDINFNISRKFGKSNMINLKQKTMKHL